MPVLQSPVFRNKYLILSSRILLTGLILGAVIYYADAVNVWEAIQKINLKIVLIPILLYFPAQSLAALRWQYSLKELHQKLPITSLMRHNARGQLSTLFLPGQISGDITRTISITYKKNEKIRLIFSVLIDKLAFFLALSMFAFSGILSSGPISSLAFIYVIIFILFLFGAFLFTVLSSYRNAKFIQWIWNILKKIKFLEEYLGDFKQWESLPVYSIKTIIILVSLGLLFQGINSIGSYILARSMGININFIDWAAIIAIIAIVQIVPITIAGIGIREGLLAGILTYYQIPLATSVGFSFVNLILVTSLIIINWLIFEIISLSKNSRASARLEQPRKDI
jgi:hypothetical protein